jgi:hypothetical protein
VATADTLKDSCLVLTTLDSTGEFNGDCRLYSADTGFENIKVDDESTGFYTAWAYTWTAGVSDDGLSGPVPEDQDSSSRTLISSMAAAALAVMAI